MHTMRLIRARLGVTQEEFAAGLGCTQVNVSYYERGQTVPPDVARKVIAYAASLGVKLSFDQVYGAAELPPPRILPHTAKEG